MKFLIGCLTLGFLGLVVAFVFMSTKHLDTTPLVAFAGGLATSLIPTITNLMKTQAVQTKMEAVRSDMAEVKQQTNGPLQNVASKVDDLHQSMMEGKHAGSP